MLRIFTYNKKLNIKNEKIKYINIKTENEIKENLLNTNRDQYLNTYLVINNEIIIKNKRLNYKNYKKINEKEIEYNLKTILSDHYTI